ncbi:sodium/hydrogen exchanger 9B2-like isoform X2 [Lycorma delicatula]|uniref:sodium/hydrogen exchanger 9B2-like isoform X2 n=1 Tax=Lycorma delicatula TaxID=130591 RepID=UPI003F516579
MVNMSDNPGFQHELHNFNKGTSEVSRADVTHNNHQMEYMDRQQSNSGGNWIIRKSKHQCGWENNLAIQILGAVIKLGLIWLLLYCIFGEEVKVEGRLFQILFLILTSYIVGQLVLFIHLPPLLGMLITGIAFRTSGYYNISGVYTEIVIVLREMALCVILIRAGLGLDAEALLRLSLVVMRLAFLPCIGESLTVAVASHILFGYPWLWGILLGFLLSAVSPAVVVPSLLSLKERGYGEGKGIATLVIGASSLDDITAISVFGISLGMIFSQGDITQQIFQGPKEVLLGLVTGVGWGILSSFMPHKDDDMVVFKRSVMVGGWGLLAVIGSQHIMSPGAGPLSCITSSLTAGIFWKLQGWSNKNPVGDIFGIIWQIMQPILFGLIGAEIDLMQLQLDTVGKGIAVILCGLLFRVISCFIALFGTNLNLKEKIFVNLAWLPKATVQAALASKALDTVYGQTSPQLEDIIRSEQVLTIAVLSILVTAPLGAIGVAVAGPLFLTKKNVHKIEQKQEP